MTRALSSTFDEAEEVAKSPQPEAYDLGESVSKYFTNANSRDALHDVRNLPHWRVVKNDPIFVEFPVEYELVPIDQAVKVRHRPDVEDEEMQEVPEDEDIRRDDHENMETTDASPTAMSSKDAAATTDSSGAVKVFPVDEGQEDVLAKLGVTGIPKPVYPTPGPAYAPVPGEDGASDMKPSPGQNEPAERERGEIFESPVKQEQRKSSYHIPPPPPPPEPMPEPVRERSPDVWTTTQPTNGRHSPARSDKSNHTMTGSDFGGPDTSAGAANGSSNSATQEESRPPLSRSDTLGSRKRSYDDSDDRDEGNEKLRQTDDTTPRSKRKHPRVSSAYSRR